MAKKQGRVTVVLDGQAGSCGKGKVVGYLALRDKPAVAINNFMSNAGHTFVSDVGTSIMTQHLPTALVNPTTELMIGPGAVITPAILIEEIIKYKGLLGNRVITIHPRAMVIEEKHRQHERDTIRSGSTFKGCASAQSEKIMRAPGVKLFSDWHRLSTDIAFGAIWKEDTIKERDELLFALSRIRISDTGMECNYAIDSGLDVLIEGSQGMDLDINYGLNYPHTTSRQCHAGQLVADCGIAPHLVSDVYMVIRPYPIRISNKTDLGIDISSGDYDGAREITWDIVKSRCGAPDNIEFGEMTTVTKKMRRVFEMNWDRLAYSAVINRPTHIVLNFAQYVDWSINGMRMPDEGQTSIEIPDAVLALIERIESTTSCPVDMIGTGAKNGEMIEILR